MFVERIHARLVRNSTGPDENGTGRECWTWTGRKDRYGYGLINVYVPFLGRNATLKAHIVSFILFAAADHLDCADDLYHAYKFLTESKLQLDHGCVCSSCINPDHVEPETHLRNQQLRVARRKARTQSSIDFHA